MTNAASIPVPTVTPRGVALASRALFAYAGALLGPLMAQYLFGGGVKPAAVALSAGVGAVAGGVVGRLVTRPSSSRFAAASVVLLGTIAAGVVGGIVSGLVWTSALDPHPVVDSVSVSVLFGGIFGLVAGAAFSAPFAFWTARARAALDAPSALRAERLTMDAGVLLCAAGALAVLRYNVDVFAALGAATCVVGTALVAASVLRASRLGRIQDAVARGELALAPRGDVTAAPALVDGVVLDHVVTAPMSAAPGASPFRTNDPARDVALVPADLSQVRRAVGATVAYGLVALAVAGVFDASLAVRALSCRGGCPSAAAPCDCAH
jgi:hypothetical protein